MLFKIVAAKELNVIEHDQLNIDIITSISKLKNTTFFTVIDGVIQGVITPGDAERYLKHSHHKDNPSWEGMKIVVRTKFIAIQKSTSDIEYNTAYQIFNERANVFHIPVINQQNKIVYAFERVIYRTSFSDDGTYPDLCAFASVNTESFDNFKQNPIYNTILEHVTQEQGAEYLENINEMSPHLLNYMESFKENDLYGGAARSIYEKIGAISPSTLRYIHVLSDLENTFGNLDNADICEIGVGYGGQCRILASYFNIRSYTLVDLPQVLGLAKVYLNNYCLKTQLRFMTMNELEMDRRYTIFISNYAFSELRTNIQDCYFDKIIKNSSSGYITYNFTEDERYYLNSYTLNDYKQKIKGLTVKDQIVPKGFENNKILIWGTSEK